jgi:hypothetical protein
MAVLTLKDVMQILRSGDWCELKCITADLVKQTGGKLIHYKKCRIARRQTMTESGAATESFTGTKKSADHNFHFTINLELENGLIRKIHPVLVYEINKQKVA